MVHFTLLTSSFIAFLRHNKKSLLLFSFMLLFIFSALRDGFGNDYDSYKNIYEIIKSTGTNSFYDDNPLFILLNKISPTFQWFIAITSFIFLFAVYKLIKKNVGEEYHGLALLLFLLNPYIFLINLSSIRQSIALALFIWAVSFAVKRKLIPFILLVFFASLFHTSAIVLLPVYFLAKPKKVSRAFLIVFIVVLAFLVLNPLSYDWMVGLFEEFLSDTRYDRYFEDAQGNGLAATAVAVVYLIYVLLNIRRLDGKAAAYGKLYLISTAISVLAYKTNLFTRFDIYFIIFGLIAIPSIIQWNRENETNRFLYMLNVYVFPAFILGTYGIKYYNFFVRDEIWVKFRTYKMNFVGFIE
ncbi:MAG: EpsG family protein [Ruminococcaceae bacterium]|nr:EpsG family protein [Oscillospiraceae bacterium]